MYFPGWNQFITLKKILLIVVQCKPKLDVYMIIPLNINASFIVRK